MLSDERLAMCCIGLTRWRVEQRRAVRAVSGAQV